MDEARLRTLLESVAEGALTPTVALEQLRDFPTADLGRVQLDQHRQLRQGFGEVIYAPGKSDADLVAIWTAHQVAATPLVITRIDTAQVALLQERDAALIHDPQAAVLHSPTLPETALPVTVTVCAAGTTDIPVAAEAACIARLSGCQVQTLWDCGVAGIHRLTGQAHLLEAADILIVVAGMEGALPSLIGGLSAKPLIAVPTSVGYGTGLGGYAALLAMLNSCAAGSVVVNIDNGFGAGFFAGRLARQIARRLASQESSDA